MSLLFFQVYSQDVTEPTNLGPRDSVDVAAPGDNTVTLRRGLTYDHTYKIEVRVFGVYCVYDVKTYILSSRECCYMSLLLLRVIRVHCMCFDIYNIYETCLTRSLWSSGWVARLSIKWLWFQIQLEPPGYTIEHMCLIWLLQPPPTVFLDRRNGRYSLNHSFINDLIIIRLPILIRLSFD